VVVLAMIATACSGGARPVMTTDRIEQAAGTQPLTTAVPVPAPTTEEAAEAAEADDANGVEQFTVEVLEQFPHDTNAFTQGLELYEGAFIESTGVSGESDLRLVDPATGAVLQKVLTPNDFFAEGVTRVGDQLIQLTWQNNVAFFWDVETFVLRDRVSYQGEGWGLCYDGDRLIMTDGQPALTFRDPVTFEETGRIDVTLDGQPVNALNELECVGDVVWANIWRTDLIVRIDPATGQVTGVVDASELDVDVAAAGEAVLNGIAWDESTQSFYITGKYWPTMFRVNFVPIQTG